MKKNKINTALHASKMYLINYLKLILNERINIKKNKSKKCTTGMKKIHLKILIKNIYYKKQKNRRGEIRIKK